MLEDCPTIPSPHDNHWTIDNNRMLIRCMSCRPVLEEVIFYFAVTLQNIHLFKVSKSTKCYLI